MLRELAEAVEALTTTRPLVLVLEDLHWSDDATLDWLGMWRGGGARTAGDPGDVSTRGSGHASPPGAPSRPRTPGARPVCGDGMVSLSDGAVAAYLAQRLPGARLPAGFARVLHQRTTGNPLVPGRHGGRAGAAGGVLLPVNRLGCVGDLTTVAASLPETLRQLLERQVEQLAVEEQRCWKPPAWRGRSLPWPRWPQPCTGAWRRSRSGGAAPPSPATDSLCVCGTDAWPDGTVATR